MVARPYLQSIILSGKSRYSFYRRISGPQEQFGQEDKNKVQCIYKCLSYECSKVKVSPLQAMKAHGGCRCKGPHIQSHGTRMR